LGLTHGRFGDHQAAAERLAAGLRSVSGSLLTAI
jgi:hypothetical protein